MVPAGMLFDTHIHLDLLPEPRNRAAQLAAARDTGVGGFLVPGVEAAGWPGLLAAVAEVAGAYAAPGLHPAAADQWGDEVEQRLAGMLADPGTVAVGEIGLDGTPGMPSPAHQEEAFRGQLRLAVACGKPVLLHCRRAGGRLLEILQEENAAAVGGILHAFSGSLETALAARRLNLVIGIGGPVTYPNARRLLQVVRELPEELLVLETDAPDLSPFPHRGEPNRPAWLRLVADKVAELRGWTPEQVAEKTTANAKRILNLPPCPPGSGAGG
jgi:TatD DNase family protein